MKAKQPHWLTLSIMGVMMSAGAWAMPPMLSDEVLTPPADTLQKIKDTGVIVIGHRESSLPFSYIVDDNNNKPIGYSLDVCQAIIHNIKDQLQMRYLKVEYMPVTPASRIPKLQAGNIDMECGTTPNTVKRQKLVSFTLSHFGTETRMGAQRGSDLRSINDLQGKVVVTTQGTVVEDYLYKQPEIKVTNIFGFDHGESFEQLESGAADAFIADDIILSGLIATSAHPKKYQIIGPVLHSGTYGIIFRKDDTGLKQIADKTLLQLIRSKEINRLYKKWFQTNIPYHNGKTLNLHFPMNTLTERIFREPSDRGM